MKLKHLESYLSNARNEFPDPKVDLEQYPTSARLTASVILAAMDNGDIGEGLSAADLGCGTGMLSLGCALAGCDYVIAIDCDEDALDLAKENAEKLELESTIDFVFGKVNLVNRTLESSSQSRGSGGRGKGRGRSRGRGRYGRGAPQKQAVSLAPVAKSVDSKDDGIPLRSQCVDTVVTNPPFGTKHNAGMDVQFLRAAVRLARRSVYSFHKKSTRDYLIRTLGEGGWGLDVRVVAEMKFEIPKMYKFHQKKAVDVEVDLIRIGIIDTDGEIQGG